MSDEEAVTGITETQAPATESATEGTKAPSEEGRQVEAVSPDQTSGETEDLTEDEWGKLSEKARRRYQKITKENAELKERNRLFESNQPRYTPADVPQQPDETVLTADQLASFVDQRVEQRERARTILEDYEAVKRDFPALNKANKDVYNEELDNFLSEGWSAASKANQKLRLKDYVAKRMGLLNKAQQQGLAEVTTKTMQQMAEAPIKTEQASEPKSKTDDLKNMSLEEMRKVLPHVEL